VLGELTGLENAVWCPGKTPEFDLYKSWKVLGNGDLMSVQTMSAAV